MVARHGGIRIITPRRSFTNECSKPNQVERANVCAKNAQKAYVADTKLQILLGTSTEVIKFTIVKVSVVIKVRACSRPGKSLYARSGKRINLLLEPGFVCVPNNPFGDDAFGEN